MLLDDGNKPGISHWITAMAAGVANELDGVSPKAPGVAPTEYEAGGPDGSSGMKASSP